MSRTKRTIRKEVKYNSDEWEKMIFLSKKSGKNPAAYIREKSCQRKNYAFGFGKYAYECFL